MLPNNDDVIDRLAAEYVLGTLRGLPRRRFERWRVSVSFVDQRCRFWEERLVELAADLNPVRPPAHVWPLIEGRLKFAVRPSAPQRLRPLALLATFVFIVSSAALIYWRNIPPIRPTAVATISARSGERLWDLEFFDQANRLGLRAAKLAPRQTGTDYELWALPTAAAPVSLGILPAHGESTHALNVIQEQALRGSRQVAVTIEPLGGSPTGQPTGAIRYIAPLVAAY